MDTVGEAADGDGDVGEEGWALDCHRVMVIYHGRVQFRRFFFFFGVKKEKNSFDSCKLLYVRCEFIAHIHVRVHVRYERTGHNHTPSTLHYICTVYEYSVTNQ